MKSIKAFDLDKTLITRNSSALFGKYLFDQGILPFKDYVKIVYLYCKHKIGMCPLNQIHLKTLNLLSSIDVDHYVCDFLKKYLYNILRVSVLEELNRAQANNEVTALFSSSPEFLVIPVAKELKMTYAFGVQWDFDRKTICPMWGEEKKQALLTLAKKYDTPKEAITCYSDSIYDLPFLEAAGIPIAVLPDRQLSRICKQKRWRVIQS